MLQPRECLTADEVRANAKAVKARLRALTSGTSPAPVHETPQLLATEPTPEPAKPFQLIRGEFSALTLAEVPMAMWWRVIRDRVAAHYGFAPEALFSRWRGAKLVEARHVAFYLTRMRTGMSHPAIGMKYGGRDHTTVLHGVQKITERRLKDPEFNRVIDDLITGLCPDAAPQS